MNDDKINAIKSRIIDRAREMGLSKKAQACTKSEGFVNFLAKSKFPEMLDSKYIAIITSYYDFGFEGDGMEIGDDFSEPESVKLVLASLNALEGSCKKHGWEKVSSVLGKIKGGHKSEPYFYGNCFKFLEQIILVHDNDELFTELFCYKGDGNAFSQVVRPYHDRVHATGILKSPAIKHILEYPDNYRELISFCSDGTLIHPSDLIFSRNFPLVLERSKDFIRLFKAFEEKDDFFGLESELLDSPQLRCMLKFIDLMLEAIKKNGFDTLSKKLNDMKNDQDREQLLRIAAKTTIGRANSAERHYLSG